MNNTLLLKSVDTLVACKDLSELANNVAQLAKYWFETRDVLVLLRSADGEFSAGDTNPALRAWADELLSVEAASGITGAEGRLAAVLHANEFDIRGVVAVLPGNAEDGESAALLSALADLSANCSVQIQRRILASRALQDTRELVVRGLHELGTPLNVLRLGMHLLEPSLSGKDPAIAQRAHRAVDRMAALIGTMADAVSHEHLGLQNEGLTYPLARTASTSFQK